jgi:BCD family chlorophyll transporter-like MFS transporter
MFFVGSAFIGFGSGLFAVTTLTAAMTLPASGAAGRGLALGAWGAAQATAAGIAVALGGSIRDLVQSWSSSGALGSAMNTPAAGYNAVYHTEILLIFITLIVLGPLVRITAQRPDTPQGGIRLADFPT